MSRFTKLTVENFRAIGPGPAAIDLAPLTILVGPNASGKSSFLEALALTAQSALEEPERHDLVLSGTRVDLPVSREGDGWQKYRELYFGGWAENKRLSVGIQLKTDVPESSTFPQVDVGYSWTRQGSGDTTRWEHDLQLDGSTLCRVESAARFGYRVRFADDPSATWKPLAAPADRVLPDASLLLSGAFEGIDADMIKVVVHVLRGRLEHVNFLSALRGTQLAQRDPGPKVAFVGKHGEQAIRLMASIQAHTNPAFGRFRYWAEQFGLKDLVAASDGNLLKVAFQDPASDASLDVAQAATGSRQALTLTANLLLSPVGSTLLIEEPENNLHPEYERRLAELMCESARSGRQIIATTHSEVLVAALGNAVRRKAHGIGPDDVAIWHLERGKSGVRAERIQVSEKGYLDKWVKSFAKVEEDLFDEWAGGLPEARP